MYNPITHLFFLPSFIHISASQSIFSSLTPLLFCFPARSPAWATVWSLRPVSEQSTSPQRALQSSRSQSNSRWISPTRRAQPPPRRMASTRSPSPCSQVRTRQVMNKIYSFSTVQSVTWQSNCGPHVSANGKTGGALLHIQESINANRPTLIWPF